jgi:Concanavalin A-like lectin/glucanases superfamily
MKKLITFFILVMFLQSVHGLVSRNNLILALDCENSTIDSRGLFSGTNNGASFISGPYGDLACDFTEPDYIAMGDRDDFTIAGGSADDKPFTISYWLMADTWGDANLDFYILEKFGTPREFLHHMSGTDELRFTLYDSANEFIRIKATLANISDGTWHHVVITYDGSESETGLEIYIDHYLWSSVVKDTSGPYAGMTNGAEGFDIMSDDGTGTFVNGTLDMLYIWKGVEYNQTEVTELYNDGTSFKYPFSGYAQQNFSWDFAGNSAGPFTIEEAAGGPTVFTLTSNYLQVYQSDAVQDWAHAKTGVNSTIALSDYNAGNGSTLMVNFTIKLPTNGGVGAEGGCFGVWHNNSYGWNYNLSEGQPTGCLNYIAAGGQPNFQVVLDEEFRLQFLITVGNYTTVGQTYNQCTISASFTSGSTYYVRYYAPGNNRSAYAEAYTDSTFSTLFAACSINIPWSMMNQTLTHFSAFEAQTQGGFGVWGSAGFIDNVQFSSRYYFETEEQVAVLTIDQNTYNVTSAYLNATAWRTATTDTVFTYDATPTVTFDLSSAGNCTISNANLNYTEMYSGDTNTLCATTGSVSQSCTLPITKRLVKGLQNIYIACAGNNGAFTNSSGLSIQLDAVVINNQTYNVTNAYINGTTWTGNENNTVFMRNRMPNVVFNTSFESNCSISKYQLNYTQMVANDSNSDCGDSMNLTHACELPTSMQLVNGAQFLYLSCLSIGAEPAGGFSTSLPLNISMARAITGYVLLANGTSNYTHNISNLDLYQPNINTTIETAVVNETGGFQIFVADPGTYRVCSHINNTVQDVCANDVVVS